VSAEGLDDPRQAKVVKAGKDGAPVTDGVFPEAKEFLAGAIGSWMSRTRSRPIGSRPRRRLRPDPMELR
jgi:hypothetical protein